MSNYWIKMVTIITYYHSTNTKAFRAYCNNIFFVLSLSKDLENTFKKYWGQHQDGGAHGTIHSLKIINVKVRVFSLPTLRRTPWTNFEFSTTFLKPRNTYGSDVWGHVTPDITMSFKPYSANYNYFFIITFKLL